MTEEWKPISGYEGYYEVSNLGNIRSVDRYVRSGNGSLRKIPSRPVAQVVTHGYKVVCLSRENKQKCIRVHKIVCSEFNGVGAPNEVVNHIDGNKMNNQFDNLEWVTQKENWEHAIRNGLAVPTYGIKEVVCLNTGRTYKSAAEAARAFGTWPGVISKICLGDRDSFYGYKFKYTGHEKKPRKRKQLNQNDMADMLLSYSIKARESKSKKELKKVIYELKEEMDLKKYDVTEMEMLEGMK